MHTQNTTTRKRQQPLSVGTFLDDDDRYRAAITISPPNTIPVFVVVRRGVVAEIYAELLEAGRKPVEATGLASARRGSSITWR